MPKGNDLCLVGGTLVTPLKVIKEGTVAIKGEYIQAIKEGKICQGRRIDVRGLFVAPGFIDIHLHGGGGHDTMEGSVEALEGISVAHARGGTTAFLATTLTAPLEKIRRALEAIQVATHRDMGGAKVLGAHLEGPYFHPDQVGAQNPAFLRKPNPKELIELLDTFSCIRRVSAAPELPGGLELGRELRQRGILASIGHSNATYQEVLEAVTAGFSHVTHIFSGMSTVTRRKAYRFAGVLESALLLDELTTEMIADGHHLPPSLMKLVVKAKGTDRVCVVTDAIAAAGLGPGHYELGGLDVIVEGVVPPDYEVVFDQESLVAKLKDRSAFAGSVATMNVLVRNLVELVELPLREAVKMATLTPARILGIDHERGLLAPGMKADIVVFDKNFTVKLTIVEGRIVYQR